jgi:spermidine synthase
MSPISRTRSLVLLALVAGSVVTAEVLFTRLLSVATWYGLAFVVLSLAMLGLTRGSLLASEASERGEPLEPWLGRQLLLAAGSLLLATVVLISLPINYSTNLSAFSRLVVLAAATAAPLVFAGAVVARLMSEAPVPLPTLYAIDLSAAAAGALLPLVLLGPLSAQGALVAISALLAVAAALQTERARRAVPVGLVVLATFMTAVDTFTHHGLVLTFAKGVVQPDGALYPFQRWNPLSLVRAGHFHQRPLRNALWSPSPITPNTELPIANANIDGEAGTYLYAYRNIHELDGLLYDNTASAHALRPTGQACVIGVGGGRDIISALAAGHDRVLGVEINPAMTQMLEAYSGRSPLLRDPRVEVRLGDGRSVYASTNMHCEVLQASLVDTWAATGAGAFAHTESTLYTREAWKVFLDRVAPAGIVTFSRWYDPHTVSETARLVSLAVASLLDRGVRDPHAHIALVTNGAVATILVSPAPFSPADLAALNAHACRMQFTLLAAPDHDPQDPLLRALYHTRSVDDLATPGIPLGLDTSAPTDDRPFFFQLLSARQWARPLTLMRMVQGNAGVVGGNITAMFELLATFLAVAVVGFGLLGSSLWRSMRAIRPPLPSPRAGVYFGALGAGFMAAEIALVQRMHVVLGHPTYALIVVLAGLLVFTGVGAGLSPRLVRARGGVTVMAVVAAVLLIALPHAVIGPLARATQASGFGVRALWTGGCAGLVGLVLGTLFPSGIRFIDRKRGAAVALAINGVTSVLGSVMAILASVWVGIPTTFALAGLIYLLAAWASPRSWPEVADQPDGH